MNNVDSTSNSAMQAGMQGYQAASESMNRAAQQLTNGGNRGEPNVLNKAAVDMMSGSLQAAASAEVIDRAAKRDGIIGSIIDTYA